MTEHQTSSLLHDATHDLAPDVERLVRGGVVRGRTRRRRRRVGASLAAAAVVGVTGVAASVGPGLLDGDSSPREARVADQGTTTPAKAPTLAPQPATPDRLITVAAEDIPGVVADTLGEGDLGPILSKGSYPLVDQRQEKVVHFRWEGTLTTFIIERADTLGSCAEMVDPVNQPDGEPWGECVVVDGLETLEWGPDTGDGVTAQGTMVWQHGYVVSALSYNAADGKDVPTVTEVPPISPGQLLELTSSEIWFAEP